MIEIKNEMITSPTCEEIREKYKDNIMLGLEKEIKEKSIFDEAIDLITDLEWCDMYYDQINKLHKEKKGVDLSHNRQRQEYDRFYQNIVDTWSTLKTFLSYETEPMLNIPPKKSDTYKQLDTLLDVYPKALKEIKDFWGFERKRLNARETGNKDKRDAFNNFSKSVKAYNEALKKQENK